MNAIERIERDHDNATAVLHGLRDRAAQGSVQDPEAWAMAVMACEDEQTRCVRLMQTLARLRSIKGEQT